MNQLAGEARVGSLRVILLGGATAGHESDIRHRLRERFTLLEASSDEVPVSALVQPAIGCDVAVILLDASQGVLPEIRHQVRLLALLGVSRIVFAVNELDAVDRQDRVFSRLEGDLRGLSQSAMVCCVPVSTRQGYNIEGSSRAFAWFDGPNLIECVAEAADGSPATGPNEVSRFEAADCFEATLVWAYDQPMLQGRSYLIHAGERTIPATVAPLKYRIDIDTQERVPAKRLVRGQVGVCQVELGASVVLVPFSRDRRHGYFTLLDPLTGEPAGVLLVLFALRRSQNLRWQVLDVDKDARARLCGQRPCIVWFTGLSGAGKSTIANLVERQLHARGYHTYLLDGDNVRHGLNKDLGFTDADRVENIRRVAEVARLMVDAGLIVLVSFISPFRSERRMARGLVARGEFFEVFVDAPLAVAEARDPKGLYLKARSGQLSNFTGVDSPYEAPSAPEVWVDTTRLTPEEGAQAVLNELRGGGILAE